MKKQIIFPLRHPAFYIAALVLTVTAAINFFIRQQFFSGSGTTDLTLFFSFVPYISIILIPALCFKTSEYNYDDFACAGRFEKIISYFTAVFFEYFLMIMFLIPACLCINLFGQIDYGQMFTGFFCLLLYGAATLSACIFISQIVNMNVAAFVVSSLLLALTNTSHMFTLYADLPDIINFISKNICFAWHFDGASKGILDSRDITFFIGITAVFLYGTFLIQEKKAGKVWKKTEISRSAAILTIIFLMLCNGQRWYFRKDFSQNKTFTVSEYSKKLIEKVEEPVKITYYRSKSLNNLYPQIRDVTDFLKIYSSLSDRISFIVKDPDNDEELKSMLEGYGVTSRQLRSVKSNSTQYINVFSAITMEQSGNIECIPFTMSADSLEFDLTGKLKHLLTGESLIVNVVAGNGLSLFNDYGYLIPWLNSQGIICNPLFVEDPNFANELGNCQGALLVIGDSEIKIDAAVAIEDYILKEKGNAVFAISPFSVDIENDWNLTVNRNTNLVEIVENWGVIFEDKILGDVSCSRITMMSDDENQADLMYQTNTNTQIINYPMWISVPGQQNATQGLTLFWPAKMSVNENAEVYLVTSPYSFDFDLDKNSPQKLLETNPFVLQTVNIMDREKSQNPAALMISGHLEGLFAMGKTENAKILVIPDPYFVNTLMTGYNGGEYGDYRNFDFISSVLLKLSGETELAGLQSKMNRNSSLFKVTDVYTFVRLQFITLFICTVLVPAAIILAGVLIWLVQKRKRTSFSGQLL